MKTEITPEQHRYYQEHGFIIIEDFLTAAELAQWREAVDDAVAARGTRRLADREFANQEDYYSKVFTQRINLWVDSPAMRKIMVNEDLGRMAAELAGVDGIRIWHDQALIKEPWANPTAWHLDNPYWSYTHRQALSIWVALDDATLQNGSLFFIDGSNNEADVERNVGIGANIGALFEVYPEWRDRQPVAAPMKAGSCSFHCGWTAHGAGANMSPGRRRAMTCGYMPDGSTFNGKKNILPDDYFESLTIGDVLDRDDLNPLLYRR